MYYKTIKKNIKNFFYSKIFFTIILIAIVTYTFLVIFTYLRHQSDSKVFTQYYGYLQRYEGIRKSTSFIPAQELLDDILKERSNIFWFSSFKEQYTLLEISVLVNLCEYEKALVLIDGIIPKSLSYDNDLHYLYAILKAILLSSSKDNNMQQNGLALFKELSEKGKFSEVALFYHGFFLRKNGSLRQADEIFGRFKKDPQFKSSPYFGLIDRVRNLDI